MEARGNLRRIAVIACACSPPWAWPAPVIEVGQFPPPDGSRYNNSAVKTFQGAAMPTINRDGVSIYYEVHGSGPPLLLTHGYSSTLAMWHGQIEALSKHHKLVLWDMRGHGQSDYPDDPAAYSEALTIADMAALLDEIGANNAIIGGLSLGGYMSLAFYRAHPQRVRALLIIDTGPGFKKDDARDAWNKRAFETGERFEREGLAVLKAGSRERSTVTHRDALGLARAARGMLTQRDARVIELLPNIKVPSLVVVGADDAPFLAASDYMAAKIPAAKKVVIPAAGHAVNIDQPQAFIEAVLPFLDGLPRDAAQEGLVPS
jgi:pimeloyl-ACP methyl ester carboxylesterase